MKTFGLGALLFTLYLLLFTSCQSSESYMGNQAREYVGNQRGLEHGAPGQFFSPYIRSTKGFGSFLKWQFGGGRAEWPKWVENTTVWQPVDDLEPGQMAIHFVNHATVMIEVAGANQQRVRFLTDPVWSERVSPVQFAGPGRVREPGIPFEKLPKIDFVLVSHNHYDHLDTGSLKRLLERDQPTILCPLGDEVLIQSLIPARHSEKNVASAQKRTESQNVSAPKDDLVRSMDWWEVLRFERSGVKIEVVFTPAQHWSARGLFDRNASLWGSFFVSYKTLQPKHMGASFYFGGDTGYANHFKEIRDRMGAPDLALLPIGAYEPRWFMKEQHMNPEEAVQAHLDLGAKQSLGVHFGTFQLTNEAIDAPKTELEAAKKKMGLSAQEFQILEEGAHLKLAHLPVGKDKETSGK